MCEGACIEAVDLDPHQAMTLVLERAHEADVALRLEVEIEVDQELDVVAGAVAEGRKLLVMLDPGQRKAAVVDTRTYGDIVTRNFERASPLENRGIEARALNEAQKAQLRKVVEAYAAGFEAPLRAERLARALDGFDSIRFAWAGATERGRPHYYRVQGPKFLIEYDASQDGGNHIHTVWRDFSGDFGRDLLRSHYSLARGTAHRH